METSQVFYRYLSWTLARPPQCLNIARSSKSSHVRYVTRRKAGTRTFASSQRRQRQEDNSSVPSSKEASSTPPSEANAQPARSFRRAIDNRNEFISKFSSPSPPSFSASETESLKDSVNLTPGPEAARKNISQLLDDVYGPIKDMVPPRATKSPGKFDPAIYDALSAYESKPRAARPLTQRTNSPTYDLAAALDASDIAADHEASIRLRLKPTLGRTVPVNLNRNVDLTRAFRMLEFKNQANKVKQEEREQRFHVRKGQMKKIMRRRRWRVTFLAGFLKECETVRRMRRQGW